MKKILGLLKPFFVKFAENQKLRNRVIMFTAVFLIFQLYFIRELIVAELLFSLGFVVCLALAAIFYVVGTIGERGFDLVEAGVRAASGPTRRGWAALEDFSRKSFRATRSESAH